MITDWSTLGLGVWVDDVRLTDGATSIEFNDFEANDGGWVVGPPPAGTDNPTNGWTRRGDQFDEGGIVATNDTLYTGFGFEGINESARNEFMKRTLTHLGVLGAPPARRRQRDTGTSTPAEPRRRPATPRAHRGPAAGQDQARQREDQVQQEPEGGPQGPRGGSRQLHR